MAQVASATCTSADKDGTLPVCCSTTLTATATDLASTIATTATAGNPGHDDGAHDDGTVNVASMAGTTCTSTAGTTCTSTTGTTCTDPADFAAAHSSKETTISNTSGRQWVYTVGNTDNNGGRNVVPQEFAGDGAGPAGNTQHFAMDGDEVPTSSGS